MNATAAQQATYDGLVANTSCASATNSLDCLRDLPFQEINGALLARATEWTPVLDGDFVADFPHNQLRSGRFVRVPVLIGCNSDEGSGQGASAGPGGKGVNTEDDLRAAIVDHYFPPSSSWASSAPGRAEQLVDELLRLYPDIQAIGIPGLDKFPVIAPGDSLAKSVGLQFRRASALAGDR